MKTNEELQRDVQDAIQWEPLLHAAEIGVTVKDGIVTLSGVVDNYQKKVEAEHAAKNVAGVKAVAETIKVKYSDMDMKTDTDIAREVLNAWNWNWKVPNEQLKVKVEDGWVKLEGTVEWKYQQQAAKASVENLTGVRGVTNSITIKSEAIDAIEKSTLESALSSRWSLSNCDIKVKVSGNKVTLIGAVNSIYQKEAAGITAWNTPGVIEVDNQLEVEYEYSLMD
jgi:Predicted periplasmic or secreted lipoprotein